MFESRKQRKVDWMERRRGDLKQKVLDPEGKSAGSGGLYEYSYPDSVRLPREGGI